MRPIRFVLFAMSLILVAGCTEMRTEGDAKIFQASAVSGIVRTVLGIALIGLGVATFVASFLPDRKPAGRLAKPEEKLSSMQRTGLALFGFAMTMLGLGLAVVPFLFTKKLHVTVYPDRVAMASTYSQAGGNEVVVPYVNLKSVEIRDEPSGIGKFKKFLVFGFQDGREIKHPASNNEMKALETIQQTLAEYQSNAGGQDRGAVATNSFDSPTAGRSGGSIGSLDFLNSIPSVDRPVPNAGESADPTTSPSSNNQASTTVSPSPGEQATGGQASGAAPQVDPPAARPMPSIEIPQLTQRPSVADRQYSLKRYVIDIPLPDDHSVVGPDTKVAIGMKLGACYAKRWESVTVVAVNDDGTITCNWDNWKAFTYKMMREDLILSNSDQVSSDSSQ